MKSTNRCTTFCDFLGIVRKLRRENLNLQETLNLMINPSDSAFLWTASSDVMIDKLYQNVSELYYGRSTWVGCSEEAPTELPMSCGNFSYTVCQMGDRWSSWRKGRRTEMVLSHIQVLKMTTETPPVRLSLAVSSVWVQGNLLIQRHLGLETKWGEGLKNKMWNICIRLYMFSHHMIHWSYDWTAALKDSAFLK